MKMALGTLYGWSVFVAPLGNGTDQGEHGEKGGERQREGDHRQQHEESHA